MTREALLKQTIERLALLPDQKLKAINDFAEFLLSRIDDQLLTQGITKMTSDSKAFRFLENEPDLYNDKELIKPFPH